LLETLYTQNLFADAVKPVVDKWVLDLQTLGQDLKDQKLKDIDFQAKLEELYKKVDLPELLKYLELDRVTKNLKYPEKGAASLGVDLSKVEGLPGKLVFGRQIFAMKKGRSVVPHGHDNMATAFLILKGDMRGRLYDRLEDEESHILIKPTIDRSFAAGETSSISYYKDNVHWFQALSES